VDQNVFGTQIVREASSVRQENVLKSLIHVIHLHVDQEQYVLLLLLAMPSAVAKQA
jgi:hypothetical protein